MIVVRKSDALPLETDKPIVATIGNFDGVHRGHQAIMSRVMDRAAARQGLSAVITFHPHPLRILATERAPRLMLTGEQKEGILEGLGLDVLIVLTFDRELADMPAETFARTVLFERIGVREVHVGPDFRFGRGRAGDVALLQKIGAEVGFEAYGIPPVLAGSERISASLIRELLTRGDARRARELLTRPFALTGTIVHGEGRGSDLLVPTANLAPENQFLPGRGVYVTRTRWKGGAFLGLTNVGIRPTFGYRRIVVETFLAGFSGDIYGERVELEFLDRVRDEKKFDSAEALREQIEADLRVLESWEEGA